MFRSFGGFENLFTPVNDGYLYYPSLKTGGKLVTEEEYQNLVQQWARVTGPRATLRVIAIAFPAVVVSAIVMRSLELSEWGLLIPILVVAGLFARVLPASRALARLVKDRPAITSPRPVSEARRQSRAMMSWPTTLLSMLMCGAFLVRAAQSYDETLTSSAVLVFWALMLAANVWTAIQKFRDQSRLPTKN